MPEVPPERCLSTFYDPELLFLHAGRTARTRLAESVDEINERLTVGVRVAEAEERVVDHVGDHYLHFADPLTTIGEGMYKLDAFEV